MYKIALCGAHGTGKSTILHDLALLLPEVPILEKTIRTFWHDAGVYDFELLPSDVRARMQLHLITNQINREDTEGQQGYITDRSVLDYWGYTIVSSDMTDPELGIFKQLISARAKMYTHFIYVPVMFEAKNEKLRARPDSQTQVAQAMEEIIAECFQPGQYLHINVASHQERIQQIQKYILG